MAVDSRKLTHFPRSLNLFFTLLILKVLFMFFFLCGRLNANLRRLSFFWNQSVRTYTRRRSRSCVCRRKLLIIASVIGGKCRSLNQRRGRPYRNARGQLKSLLDPLNKIINCECRTGSRHRRLGRRGGGEGRRYHGVSSNLSRRRSLSACQSAVLKKVIIFHLR